MKTKGINEEKDIDDLIWSTKDLDIKNELRTKDMMRSIYAYNTLSKDDSYLTQYRKELGEEIFNEVYDEYSKFLHENFTIEHNTYTDGEGCSYNSLIRKNND